MARPITCPNCGHRFELTPKSKWPGDYFEWCSYCVHWQEEPPEGQVLAEYRDSWCGKHQDGTCRTAWCPAFKPDEKWLRAKRTSK